jgi:4'-phosphopantetheinyl transferase
MSNRSERFTAGPGWTSAAEPVFPAAGEVILLVASLDLPRERLERLLETFSPRERERYQSFAHEEHRFRWGAARGLLREVLGRATGREPARVGFRYAEHGKPHLDDGSLRFNISHSGGAALIALARVEVGVDIELPRPRRTDDLARRFFAPVEQERLFALEGESRRDAFFRLWTCKEAFLKATGEGFSRSLRSYEIDPSRGRVLWATGIPDAADRFSVHPLDPGGPYRAALVTEPRPTEIRKHRWP